MDANRIVCTTTFRQGSAVNRVELIRTEVFLDTVYQISGSDIPLVAVYTDTQPSLLDTLVKLGVTGVAQQTVGMGSVRREAIAAALTAFPEAAYFCWLEPEKPDMLRFIKPMRDKMVQEQADLGIFNRIDMSSYPSEQAHYYLFCRAVASQFVGLDVDYAFGPVMMSRRAASYFLQYAGEYGDKWDSILVPRLRLIHDRAGLSILPIDFRNDPRMTQVESGNPSIILKRLDQFNNVVPSLITEWQKLKGA